MEKMFKPKKCKMCGKEFVPNCGVQVYCSYECKLKRSNAEKRKTYQSMDSAAKKKLLEKNAKYHAEWQKKQTRIPVYGYCKYCGKKFDKKGNKQYCCEEHKAEYWKSRDSDNHKSRYIPVAPHETVCKACGKTFLGKWGAKYCTDCCPDRYYANRTVNLKGAFDVSL